MGIPSFILQQLHRIESASCERIIQAEVPARALAYGAEGSEILAGHEDGIPRLWDASHFSLLRELPRHDAAILAVAARGSRWATGCAHGVIRITQGWNEVIGAFVPDAAGTPIPCWSLAWNLDGSLLLAGHEDHSARLYSVTGGSGRDARLKKRMFLPAGGGIGVRAVAFGPEDAQVGLLYGGGAAVWEGDREHPSAMFPLGDVKPTAERHLQLAFSRDRRMIAAAIRSQEIVLSHWDEAVTVLKGHTDLVTSLAWSPEGRFLISGSEDCTVRIWDTTTRDCVCVINDNVGAIWGVAFHPHGHDCAAVGEDGTIRIYELGSTWFEIKDAIAQASEVLAGKHTKLWPTTAPLDLDFVLDVWGDLRRRARHARLTPELATQGEAVRQTALELLALLCDGASPFVPPDGLERYKHPLFRVALADLRLASDLCLRLGGDAVAMANLAKMQRVPTIEVTSSGISIIPPRVK